LKALLAAAESKVGQVVETVFHVGDQNNAQTIALKAFPGRVSSFIDLQAVLTENSQLPPNLSQNPEAVKDLGPVLGLAALLENDKNFEQILNFRKGKFAYKPALGDIVKGLQENSHWMIAATVEESVSDKEEQLRDLGSLASLSPLNSIRELSSSITKEVDTLLDSVNIANSRILIKGSVPDFPSVGRLESALEANTTQFCSVSVQPKGKKSGTNRINFTVDIKLCE